jgi:hypothetical protein
MKEFNLDQVIAGAKVVDKQGNEWKFAGYNPNATELHRLIFWDHDGCGRASTIDGKIGTANQLFLAPTERKEWIVRYVHKVQKHIMYCSSPQESYDAAEHFALGIKQYFDYTIHEITIIE